MWLWVAAPIAAIFLHGWMIEQIGQRGGNLAYAAIWLVASALTTFGHAPSLVRGFCLLVFGFTLITAPVVRRGDLQSVFNVNPFHKPWIKWTMAATCIVLVLWK
jgi:hypothetical protein